MFEEIKRTGHASKRSVRDLISEARGTLLVDKSIGTIGLTIAAALAVFTIPMMGWLSDRFGRRLMYRLVALFTCLWAFPAFWLFTTKDPVLIVISMAVAIGVGVFGMYGISRIFRG